MPRKIRALKAEAVNEPLHYSMVIEWSDEDRVYVVTFPEWGRYAHTHGSTYEEAARHGREVLELLVGTRLQ